MWGLTNTPQGSMLALVASVKEEERLRMRASAAGQSMSEWARELLLSGLGPGVTAEISAEIERCHAEIAALRTQIAGPPTARPVYDPAHATQMCVCGHIYRRHFNPDEGMAFEGCKYCGCREFRRDAGSEA